MTEKRLNILLGTLLLLNPLVLLLLSHSIGLTVVLSVCALVIAFFVSQSNSLRIKVWAFNLFAILSICLHCELLFREFFSAKNIPNLYELHGKYYFNKPFLDCMFRTNEYASSYKTNCQGYRMDDLSNANDTVKACDWLFIGDSFTQGAQVYYRDLYTTLLYESFPNKVIVNAGISGAGLYDELNYLKNKGKELNPKVVFLQIGVFNDFFNIKERSASYQDWLMEKSDLYRYFAYNIFSTDSLPLGRWTEPFFPTEQDNRDYNILYKEQSEQKCADREAFRKCIKEWKEETERIGAKLILFLIPSKEQVSPSMLKEVMNRYNIQGEQLDMSAPSRLFKTTASNLGLTAYDLTVDFKESKIFPFFYQDEHLNTIGHKIIADALTKRLTGYADGTSFVSRNNNHERYPSFCVEDSSLLLQGQTANEHLIVYRSLLNDTYDIWVKSFEELVHPTLSPDRRYLAYTSGNQEYGETDVLLQDNILGTTKRINVKGQFAAIPAFSHNGNILALPIWTKEKKTAANIWFFDINQSKFISHIPSESECWRPIFNNNDSQLLYIQKAGHFRIVSQPIKITSRSVLLGKSAVLLSLPYDIWDIAISPSGKHLVFAGNKDGNWDLFSYTFATKKVCQLTHTLGNEWDPTFGVTDNDLWYAGTFGFNDGIYYMRISL